MASLLANPRPSPLMCSKVKSISRYKPIYTQQIEWPYQRMLRRQNLSTLWFFNSLAIKVSMNLALYNSDNQHGYSQILCVVPKQN
jgi:hypothetical protein